MAFFGLMTVGRHNRIVAKADAVIDDAAQHLRAEEFSAGRTLGQKVSIALKRLEEARNNAFRNRQMALTLEAKVEALSAELATLKVERDGLMRDKLAEANRVKSLSGELREAMKAIADLRPDAEKHRERLRRDREYVAAKRAPKAA